MLTLSHSIVVEATGSPKILEDAINYVRRYVISLRFLVLGAFYTRNRNKAALTVKF